MLLYSFILVYRFILKKYLTVMPIIIIVIREVISLSNNLSVVESFRSTSGSKLPSVDAPIVVSSFGMLVGQIKDNDIRLPQATCVFFSMLSPL